MLLLAHLGYSTELAQIKRGISVPHRASLAALGASSTLLGEGHDTALLDQPHFKTLHTSWCGSDEHV